MTTLADLGDVLPPDAIAAWPHVAAAVPDDGILMGGTALAVHLHHRVSRDLDVFTQKDFDPEAVARLLEAEGAFAVTSIDDGTLNGVFGRTKVQVLWAQDQSVLEPPIRVSGMQVGSLSDILATKLKVLGDRGELRDYYDLMKIERDGGRTVDEAVALLLARYGPDRSMAALSASLRALGFLDDVTGDPFIEGLEDGGRDTIVSYWRSRQPQVLANLDPHVPLL